MADRYWIGGTGNWSDTAHWSATSGGAGGASVPTSADNAIFDGNSDSGATFTVTLTAAANCLGFTVAGLDQAMVLAGTGLTNVLNIYGSSVIPATGFSSTLENAYYKATTTGFTINHNDIAIANAVTLSGVGGEWTLASAFRTGTTSGGIFNDGGTFRTANHAVTAWAIQSSNSYVRAFYLGSSTVTLTGGGAAVTLYLATTTNLTFDAGTSSIVFTHAGPTTYGGSQTLYDLSFTYAASTLTMLHHQPFTCRNLTVAARTTLGENYMRLTANITVTGTLSLQAGSASPNYRLVVYANTLGTPVTITAAAVSLTNCTFVDIAGAGAAAPFTGTSLGDALGNSGITFDASVTQYFYAPTTGTKLWSAVGNWFLGSGGTGGAGRVPLPQDNVIFNGASIGAASTAISVDVYRLGKDITWAGVTNTPSWSVSSVAPTMYGSLTTVSGMVWSNGNSFLLAGRSSHTINLGGLTVTGGGVLYVYSYGGTYTAQSAITLLGHFNLYYGTFADGGYSITAASANSTNSNPRGLNATGAWTMTGSGSVWNFTTTTGLTWTAAPSTLKFTDVTATNKVVAGGGKAYNIVWFASPTLFQITGSNTFANFRADPGAIIQTVAGTTQTAATYTIDGRPSTGTDAPCGLVFGGVDKFTTPDAVANQITGDIAFTAALIPASWASGIFQGVINKDDGGNRQYGFALGPTYPSVYLNIGGSGADYYATVATPFSSGALGYIAAAWFSATGTLKFFTSTTGEIGTWTQLGVDRTTLIGTLSFKNTIIGVGGGNAVNNRILNAQIFNGVPAFLGGAASNTPAVSFDAARYPGSGNTFTASTGEVWTRNGNAQFTATNLTTIMGVTNAAFTLAKSGGGVVACRDLSLRNATASPVSTFYAGARSYDGGGNINWTFNNAPATAALAATDADSTATAAASVSIAAAADQHDQADSAIAAGAVTIAAALAATDSQELLSVGTVQIGAALAAFDGNEQLMAAAAVQIGADLALTDDDDTLAASGYVWRLINDARYLKPVTSNRNVGPVKGIQL